MTERIVGDLNLRAGQGDTLYRVMVIASTLEPEPEDKAQYFVDLCYSPVNGHAWLAVSKGNHLGREETQGYERFSLPLEWMPTRSQLEQIALQAVEKAMRGQLKETLL